MNHIPNTKTFNGKVYKLHPCRAMMNKGKANNTAAQLRKDGYMARVVAFMTDNQPEYLCYYRSK